MEVNGGEALSPRPFTPSEGCKRTARETCLAYNAPIVQVPHSEPRHAAIHAALLTSFGILSVLILGNFCSAVGLLSPLLSYGGAV
jgi:hypothetical protein